VDHSQRTFAAGRLVAVDLCPVEDVQLAVIQQSGSLLQCGSTGQITLCKDHHGDVVAKAVGLAQ
jgi:hypothetical protein